MTPVHALTANSVLSTRFSDSAEYDLEDVNIDLFIATLVESDHFLVYTQSFEEDGTYVVAPPSLRDHPDVIRRMLVDAFYVNEIDESSWLMETGDQAPDEDEDASYLLVLSPRTRFLWNGLVLMLQIPKIDLHLEDNRVRLIADGSQHRLAAVKRQFAELFEPDEDESDSDGCQEELESEDPLTVRLRCESEHSNEVDFSGDDSGVMSVGATCLILVASASTVAEDRSWRSTDIVPILVQCLCGKESVHDSISCENNNAAKIDIIFTSWTQRSQ